jgi:transposase
MFIRKKSNKSGSTSVQIIDKSKGKYEVIKTIGSSSDPKEIERLLEEAEHEKAKITGQFSINFHAEEEEELVDLFYQGLDNIRLVGPELLLGSLFDQIGFNRIKDELFRHLVITRLCFPVSKLKTTDYLFKYKGLRIDVERIYRYLDKLYNKQKDLVHQISYDHTCQILDSGISVVFYDVTTLYFETDLQDDLRKSGFSKDGKHQHPQIVLGLLVSIEGYPLAYEVFEGNKFEGHTMLPVVEAFKLKFNLQNLVLVADAGLLSNTNIIELQSRQYEYILGARIKNEKHQIREQILSLSLKNGESAELVKDYNTRLIISYSDDRAKKDKANREKGLQKLEKAIQKGKLTKSNINNRGYNKYLKLDGDINISIDYNKFNDDQKWDGLKGYVTNTKLSKKEVIDQYGNLWKIERAFRISKTDLKIRPIYHRLRHRIEAHICIAFSAYKLFKELERQLKENNSNLSPEKAIEIANTIFSITIITPFSKKKVTRLHLQNQEQKRLLKMFNLG